MAVDADTYSISHTFTVLMHQVTTPSRYLRGTYAPSNRASTMKGILQGKRETELENGSWSLTLKPPRHALSGYLSAKWLSTKSSVSRSSSFSKLRGNISKNMFPYTVQSTSFSVRSSSSDWLVLVTFMPKFSVLYNNVHERKVIPMLLHNM